MIEATAQAIRDHAAKEFPRESCGVVIIVNGKERYYPCANKAATPNEHFVIDPKDRARAEDLGELVAIVHSHPIVSAQPSEADLVMCEKTGLEWHIVHVSVPDGETAPKGQDIHSFRPSGYETPLVGRTFSHGILDCYTLVQDYYRRELGIELPWFERRDGWWDVPGYNLYLDNFRQCGFVPVPAESLREGDTILMQIRSKQNVPNHAAVYIGDGRILHHVMGRMSSRDVYDGYWQENTRMILRYKGTEQ